MAKIWLLYFAQGTHKHLMEPSIGILATRTAKWAVREGDWKLIGNVQDSSGGKLNSEDQKLFLANLSEDPTERINLANRNPEIV